MTTAGCHALNARGERCDAPQHMIVDGLCPTHRPGGSEQMRAIGAKGGVATARRHEGGAFTVAELPPLVTIEDAKTALDVIRVGVLTRKITHSEGASAAKAVSEWVKAESAAATARLVGELTKELDAKTEEIAELRRALAAPARLRAG